MPAESQDEMVTCPMCGLQVPETELQECFVCHALFCQYCALHAYGRTFCTKRCRGFFFWGDGDTDGGDS